MTEISFAVAARHPAAGSASLLALDAFPSIIFDQAR
jgi:hypothetical protein